MVSSSRGDSRNGEKKYSRGNFSVAYGGVREREVSKMIQVYSWANEWMMEPFTAKKCRRTTLVGEAVSER